MRKIMAREAQDNIATIVEYPMTVRVGDDGQSIREDVPPDVFAPHKPTS